MILWHPDAERHVIPGREGKSWRASTGKRRVILHTWEFTTRWPNYTTPPHLSLWPRPFQHRAKLRQHVPFDRAAYSITDEQQETARMTWQIEIAGQAAEVPNYPQVWYDDVSALLSWFVVELDVPWMFADFSVMLAGADAPQRWDWGTFSDFAGYLGHGHAGKGRDRHWDPGKLDVSRLEEPMSFANWVAGWVEGQAEDPDHFRRYLTELKANGRFNGNVDYYVNLLNNPTHPEWPGWYSRTELAVWAG